MTDEKQLSLDLHTLFLIKKKNVKFSHYFQHKALQCTVSHTTKDIEHNLK